MRKSLFLSLVLSFILIALKAQIHPPAPASSPFAESLSKITNDFRNNYYNIQAGRIESQADMDTYRSAVSIPGAKNCVIYRFHSRIDTTAGWQATMYKGDNYSEALKIYKNTCRQIEKSKLTLGVASAGFKGKMEEPDANLRFVNSDFKLKAKDKAYAAFHAEVELLSTTFDQWEVHLNLHNKNDDNDEED